MADHVRIALNSSTGPLKWPQRCPRCGSKDDLVYLDTRVVRENKGTINSIVQERFEFSVLMCRKHAHANQIGGRLLENGIVMTVLRWSIYLAFFVSMVSLYRLLISGGGLQLILGTRPAPLLYGGTYGLLGLFGLIWARQVSAVRPVSLDPDHDIAVLRFADDKYAREFKRMNLKATTGREVATLPTFLRPSWFKLLLLIVGVLILIAIRMK